jgi:hypothetical protein
VRFTFDAETEHYFVAKDMRGDERILGWLNPKKLLERDPSARLVIEPKRELTLVQRTYTVWKPVYETKSRECSYTVWKKIPRDGGFQWVPEKRVKTYWYTVRHFVPEQKVRTHEVVAWVLGFSARGATGRLQSRVTFRTETDGAYVRYHAAARVRNRISNRPTPVTLSLDIGDYVVWTERDRVRTSVPEPYPIYRVTEDITIPESTAQQ